MSLPKHVDGQVNVERAFVFRSLLAQTFVPRVLASGARAKDEH